MGCLEVQLGKKTSPTQSFSLEEMKKEPMLLIRPEVTKLILNYLTDQFRDNMQLFSLILKFRDGK